MKKVNKKYNRNSHSIGLVFALVVIVVVLSTCRKERSLEVPPTQREVLPTRTSLDLKIKQLYEKYDIKFDYKWDRSIYPYGAQVYPMSVINFTIFLESFEELYIQSLLKVQDPNKNFLKYVSPLNILFTGSGISYGAGDEQSRNQGVAGLMLPSRIVVGIQNDFKKTVNNTNDAYLDEFYDFSGVKNKNLNSRFSMSSGALLGLYFHEFTHFINNIHPVPVAFSSISKKDYLPNAMLFDKYSFAQAREKGFVMNYGMINDEEDFATYVQVILKESDEEFKKHLLVNDKIKIKYQIVLDFFKHLGLDLLKFRDQMHSKEVKDKLLQIKKKYMK